MKELLSPAMELPDSSGLHHPTAAAVNSKTRRSWTFVLKTNLVQTAIRTSLKYPTTLQHKLGVMVS